MVLTFFWIVGRLPWALLTNLLTTKYWCFAFHWLFMTLIVELWSILFCCLLLGGVVGLMLILLVVNDCCWEKILVRAYIHNVPQSITIIVGEICIEISIWPDIFPIAFSSRIDESILPQATVSGKVDKTFCG